jgi:hypothetical protein
MKKLTERMLRHLREKKVGYFHHLFCALGYSLNILVALVALLVHAFLPFAFEKTASDRLQSTLEKMK